MNTFKDKQGRFITQGLFLELDYDVDHAIYTLADEDKEYNGKTYPSIKRLYLESNDPTEYTFATSYFYSWEHWQRIVHKTKRMMPYIQAWRDELEIKLVSEGIKKMISHAADPKGQTAAKWLADKGWGEKRKAGAPSKEERARELKIKEHISNELEEDFERMKEFH